MTDTINRTDNVVVVSRYAWSRGATIAKARKVQRLKKTESHIAYIFNHDEWTIVGGDPQWPHDVSGPVRLFFEKGEVVNIQLWNPHNETVMNSDGPTFDDTQKSKYAWMDHEGWRLREEVEKAEAEAKHKLETAMHEELSEDEILEHIEQAEIARGALGHGTAQRGWQAYRYWTAVAERRGIEVA